MPPRVIMLPAILLLLATGGGRTPEAAARGLFEAYLKQGNQVGNFEGARKLGPFLSRRLRTVIDDAAACQADWTRQQPKESTDKPPFVDCCFFASSPEGIPTAFELGAIETLADRRYKVTVEFTYAEAPGTYSDPTIPLQTLRWRDAVLVKEEGGRYVVDDFVFQRDAPRQPPLLLSERFRGCRGRRWIGGD